MDPNEEQAYTWTQLCYGEVPAARRQHQMCCVGGKVVIVGGGAYRALETEPSAAWGDEVLCGEGDVVQLLEDLVQHCSCTDGKAMYIIGGWRVGAQRRNHLTYVVRDGTVSLQETSGAAPGGVTFAAAAYCSSGVYVFGGCTTEVTNNLWLLNEATGAWSLTGAGPAPAKRSSHTMTTAGDKLLIFGGKDAEGKPLNDTHCFEAPISTWVRIDPSNKPTPRYGHSATAYKGVLYMYGGLPAPDEGVYMLDMQADQLMWTEISTTDMPGPRSYAGFCASGSKLCLFGGELSDSCTATNELHMLDIGMNDMMDLASQVEDVFSQEEEEEEEEDETLTMTQDMTLTSTLRS